MREIANPELSWRFDFGRGQALQSLGRDTEALSAFQDAVKTIETVRNELREQRFRAGYIEDKYQVYVALVQLLLKLGRAEEAFVAAEKLRARSYLDMISRGQPPIRNQSQREKEETLRSRVRNLQRNLEKESSKPGPEQKRAAIDSYSKELTSAESEYEKFIDDILSSEPSYAAVRSLKVPTGAEVSKQLTADTALVGYVLGENVINVFVITVEGLKAKTISTRGEDLKSRVETLRDLMLRKQTNEWKLPSASLYDTLIAPIEREGWLKQTKQLYIIPHAILHYVPFAALGKNNDLLIDKYVVAYLPAAAALVRGEKSAESRNSILAMAPANTRLQYTRLESENVSSLFSQTKHCVSWFTRDREFV